MKCPNKNVKNFLKQIFSWIIFKYKFTVKSLKNCQIDLVNCLGWL